ncbi:MAG: ABC transporter substrate-binding protein [Desulfobacterales bacterium]|jgi:peptide/nickel transport system substrate-binding protein
MKAAAKKRLVFLGVLVFFLLWGGGIVTSAVADNRPDLVVAVQKLPPVLEPMLENSNVHQRITYSIAEPLIMFDYANNQKLVPGLAVEWKRLDDRTLELKLRKGVTFHNGEEMTAEDVAFSFGPERLFHEKRGKTFAQMYLGNLEPIEVIDRYTVRIRSKIPDFLLEKRLANYMSEIVSKKGFMAAKDWETWSRNAIGTGPYKIAELKTGDYIKLKAFDDYWGPKAPAKTVTFRAVPEVAARIAGLKTGEYHIITEIPPDQLESIDKAKGCSTVGGPIPNIRTVQFDETNNLLKSPELRQAMIMAIDRQLIVDSLYHGRTSVPNGYQMKLFGPMYIENFQSFAYNPDQARELIKKSGYNGETIYYRILPDYYTLEVATAQILVEMWKAVGLNVKIEMKENWSQILKNDETRHLYNVSNTAFYGDPVGQLWRRLGPQSWMRLENKYGGKEPVYIFDEKFDTWGKTLETSTDLGARRSATYNMLKYVEFEDPAQVNLHALTMFYGKRNEVVWTAYPDACMDLSARNLSFK